VHTECLEGFDAQPIDGYGMVLKDRHLLVDYPRVDDEPQTGRSFHNGRFIAALRKAAVECPSVELRQGTVGKLLVKDGRVTGVQYRSADDDTVKVRVIQVARYCMSSPVISDVITRMHRDRRLVRL